MELHLETLNPKAPNSSSSPTSEGGKRLLNLLKSLERLNKNETSEENPALIENEILFTISEMKRKYQCKGLFENKESRVAQSSIPTSLPSVKKRKRGGANSTGKIASLLNLDGSNSTGEAYAISNLCRILIPQQQYGTFYPSSIIISAAEAFYEVCEYCKGYFPNETTLMEHEMISSIASQLLTGLGRTMRSILDDDDNEDDKNDVFIACCKCATNVIILANTKLSRNEAVTEIVENVAKDILFYNSGKSLNSLVEASAGLIATIPLAGSGSSNKPPMHLWSDMVTKYVVELSATLKTFFPFLRQTKQRKNISEDTIEWIREVKEKTSSQTKRLVIFFSRIKGVVAVLNSLIQMDGYYFSNSRIGALIPVTILLEACEQMLLFPSIAETRFLATKTRLRSVSIEGGLLSTESAVAIANRVKMLGHTLFDVVVSTLTTNSLQYGRQIIRINLTSLQSSSSLTLRTMIDPMSCADNHSKQKWLHSSIVLRTSGIQSFGLMVQRLGSNAIVTQNEAMSKAVTLIAGCLLEQLSADGLQNDCGDEHCGTANEKATLISTCADTMSSFLSVLGGFMTIDNRELIESVALTCLCNITNDGNIPRSCNFIPVKISFLRLGINCITSPWPDGGATTIVGSVRRAAFSLKFARDTFLSSTAYSALSICDMAQSSRAPPLAIMTRSTEIADNVGNKSKIFSRSLLEGRIHAAKDESLRSKLIEKDVTEKKSKTEIKKIISPEPMNGNNTNDKAQRSTDKSNDSAPNNRENDTYDMAQVNKKTGRDEDCYLGATLNEQRKVHSPVKPDGIEYEDVQIEEISKGEKESAYPQNDSGNENESDDDGDFPPIIDCSPDEEDM